MAQTYQTVSMAGFMLAAAAAIAAVVLCAVLKIPAVVGDLSGRTAKKSIEKSRRDNDAARGKSPGQSLVKGLGYSSGEILPRKAEAADEDDCTEFMGAAEKEVVLSADGCTEFMDVSEKDSVSCAEYVGTISMDTTDKEAVLRAEYVGTMLMDDNGATEFIGRSCERPSSDEAK